MRRTFFGFAPMLGWDALMALMVAVQGNRRHAARKIPIPGPPFITEPLKEGLYEIFKDERAEKRYRRRRDKDILGRRRPRKEREF